MRALVPINIGSDELWRHVTEPQDLRAACRALADPPSRRKGPVPAEVAQKKSTAVGGKRQKLYVCSRT